MIRLIQEFGAHAGRQLAFDRDVVRLGRAPSNDVVFDAKADLEASGLHCEIVREHGGYVVADRGSRNGTLINGVRVARQRLQHGDVIECGLGGPRLRVELATAQAPEPRTPAAPYDPRSWSGAQPSHPRSGPGSLAPLPPSSPQLPAAPQGYPAPSPASPHAAGAAQLHTPSAPLPAVAPPMSVGAAVVARLPPNAQIGKRTMAMMIDAAVAQAAAGRAGPGSRIALALLVLLVVAVLVGGGVFLLREKQHNDERLAALASTAGERITQRYEGAIYMLAAERTGTSPRGFCSGFAVTTQLIATNAHCIDVAQELLARGSVLLAMRSNGRGARVVVEVAHRDPRYHNPQMGAEGLGYDVGVMRVVSGGPLPVRVRLATADEAVAVRPGAQIYVYGFPGLTMNEVSPVATITAGIVNRSTDFFDRAADPPLAQKIQHTAQTTSGSSGSPIFLANGTVIAVNAGSLADEERQSMIDPRTGQRVSVEVNRSSSFKYGMRADLIREAIGAAGGAAP